MRLIDADALELILNNAIEMMRTMAKALGCEDDPEIQMEIKAYTDILNGVKEQQTIEPERPTEPQIICCKDCKHYEHDVGNEEYGVCCNPQWVVGNVGCGVSAIDSCSYAERKTDA